MATEVHQFTATIPKNTPQTALSITNLVLDNRSVESIDLEVPAGPAGLMGFYLARSGTQVIPFEDGEYIVWDDRFKNWPMSDLPTSQGWQIVGYNLDLANDHDVVVRLHTNPVIVRQPSVPSINIIQSPAPMTPMVLA